MIMPIARTAIAAGHERRPTSGTSQGIYPCACGCRELCHVTLPVRTRVPDPRVGLVVAAERLLSRSRIKKRNGWVGAVVEVRYLYAFKESRCLYQPTYLGQRSDVTECECVVAQLKYKSGGEEEES